MVDEAKLRRLLSITVTHYLTPAEVLDIMAQVNDGETGSDTCNHVVDLLMDTVDTD